VRGLCLVAVLLAACGRAPAVATPPTLAALAALRDAFDRNDLARATDPEALARAELVHRLAELHAIQEESVPLGVTADGWRRALDDIHTRFANAGLLREFEPARGLLGNGRCAQTAPASVPDALNPVASARPTWPPFVEQSVRAPLAQRARGARAGEFRCEGGTAAFRAVFLPSPSGDGLVVARITVR